MTTFLWGRLQPAAGFSRPNRQATWSRRGWRPEGRRRLKPAPPWVPLALIALATTAAASPVIRGIEPRGAQKGKSFQLVVNGSDLPFGAKLETTLPANISRLAPSKEMMRPDSELPFLIELKKDAAVGLYPLRVITNDGLSNVVLFSVGELPEHVEIESEEPKKDNGSIKDAQPLPVPGVITGTLTGADLDFYAITVKAGERLVLETEAAAAGSAIDTAIEILDASEKIIVKNDDAPGAASDARIEHTFTKPGKYYVRMHDSRYSDQAVNFYRLKVGSYPYAEALFPLGGQRGKPVDVQLLGGNLVQPQAVKPDTSATLRFVPVQAAGSASLPMLFVLGDGAETMEPAAEGAALAPDVVMNGRVAKKGEVDKFKLAVTPGEHWVIEVQASSLGTSQLDALVTVYGPDGKKLVSRDDLGSADPALPFEVPADVREVTVAIEDLLGRGGLAFGYRLKASRGPADFTVALATPFVNVPAGGTMIVPVVVQRRGYDGEVRVRIADLPAGLRQAGGNIPPAAAQQRFDDPNPRFSATRSTITVTADDDIVAGHWQLKVIATAETPHGRIDRVAEGPGFITGVRGARQKAVTAAWLEMGLPLAISKRLPVRLTTPVPLARIAQGVEFEMRYRIERSGGARINGRVRETTASAIGNLRILQGPPAKTPDTGSLLLNTNFETPATTFDMYLQATADIDGQRVDVYTPMITVDVVKGYQVHPQHTAYAVAAGGKVEVAGTVYREPTFEGGLVKVEVQDLPDGVRCASAEVSADSRAFRIACEAGAEAKSGDYEVRLASTAPDTGRKAQDTYKGADVALKLKIEGAARAAR
jgi:hypothetical protein